MSPPSPAAPPAAADAESQPIELGDLPSAALARVVSFIPPFRRLQLIGRVSQWWDLFLFSDGLLGFGGAPSHVRLPASALAALCRRAGAQLRSLDVSAQACCRLHASDVLAALEHEPKASSRLDALVAFSPLGACGLPAFSLAELAALRSLCPSLRRAHLVVRVGTWSWSEIPPALEILPPEGCLKAICRGDIRSGSAGPAGAAAVAETLRASPHLTAIDFSDQRIESEGLRALCDVLQAIGRDRSAPPQQQQQRQLVSLELGGNNLREDSVMARFAAALPGELVCLDLSGNERVTAQGLGGRAEPLRNLQRLALGGTAPSAASLRAALSRLPALTHLDVSCACGVRDAAPLALAACGSRGLKSLDFHGNDLVGQQGTRVRGGGGMQALVEAFAGLPALETLLLGRCGLGDAGAVALARALAARGGAGSSGGGTGRGVQQPPLPTPPTTLRQLDLSSNGLRGEAAEEVVGLLLRGCPALESLELQFNALSAEERAALRETVAAAAGAGAADPPELPLGRKRRGIIEFQV